MWSLSYTSHHNWRWIVQDSIKFMQELCGDCIQSIGECERFKELPSQQNKPKMKAEYSLFRLDLVSLITNAIVLVVRLDSEGFSDLDPKDSLYRRLLPHDAAACMPETTLIPWNATAEDINILKFTVPALLKASMGSGGFGLYYVYHPRDILAVIMNHRKRAENEPRFMENLIDSYEGADPCWNLQEIVSPMRVTAADGQVNRTQIRAYVVLCNNELYLYDGVEVRVPSWDIDIDQVLLDESSAFSGDELNNQAPHPNRPWSESIEEECCGDGNARPYNEQRNKKRTNRLMLEEIESMEAGRETIRACVISAFSALKESIQARHITKAASKVNSIRDENYVSMAIVGVDLLLSQQQSASSNPNGFRAVIVEVNNNPAMPGENKQMSVMYRAHLRDMVSAFMLLGLSTTAAVEQLSKREQVAELVAKFKQI